MRISDWSSDVCSSDLFFIGHGVTLSEAGPELTALAQHLSVPVISSPNGMGCLDMRDEPSLGFIGRNGAYPANQAGRHADHVLAVGARFADRPAPSWKPGTSGNFPATKLAHVHADAQQRGPHFTPAPGHHAEHRTYLRQLP